MGRKRKNTAERKTPPSKGRRPKAALTQAPPPPAPSAIVTYHQPEDGGRPVVLGRGAVVAVSAAEEVMVKLLESFVPKKVLSCHECHGSPKAPIFQCSRMRHIACINCVCGAGKCRLCEGKGDAAVYQHSPYLDDLFSYHKVPCPFSKYGCASSVVYGDVAAHAAACACTPCACQACSFEGSPAELVRHLTDKAGRHAWTATKIKYGEDISLVFNVRCPQVDDLFVADEDGGVFTLFVCDFVKRTHDTVDGTYGFNVLCVRNNSGAGPVYSSTVTVVGPPDEGRRLTVEDTVTASCADPPEAAMARHECALVYPEMRQGEEIHLRICIRKNHST